MFPAVFLHVFGLNCTFFWRILHIFRTVCSFRTVVNRVSARMGDVHLVEPPTGERIVSMEDELGSIRDLDVFDVYVCIVAEPFYSRYTHTVGFYVLGPIKSARYKLVPCR